MQDITVSPTLSAGVQVTFTGVVTDPSGAWGWTVLDDGGATLATSSDEGSLDFTVPAGASTGDTFDVRLQVGTSAPVTRTFTVGLTGTVTTVTVNKPTAGAGEPVTTTVTVTAAGGGPVPEGSVHLTFDVPRETPRAQDYGAGNLAGGTTDLGPRSFPDADQTVTAQVTYTPTDGVHAGSTGSTTIQVIDSCRVVRADDAPLDVRATRTIGTAVVQLVNCPSPPPITWTRASWLGSRGGGGTADLQSIVDQIAEPPVDGLNPGSVTASLPNGSTVSFDVLGNRAPVLVPGSQVCAGGTFRAQYEDADQSSLSVEMVHGFYRHDMDFSPAEDRFVFVLTEVIPPATQWQTTAVDSFGLTSVVVPTPGSCV